MASRVFALIIGIDNYISRKISNLSSCASDALRIRNWLVDDLKVPVENLCLLLNEQATKQSIENAFMIHLVSNAQIERGDAILLYFAGHGSSVAAPEGWCDGGAERVEILCTHDHDMIPTDSSATDSGTGRISGLTDWSLHAMLRELCASKGDNVALILDCCFNPLRDKLKKRRTPVNSGRRGRSIRWTPTSNEVTSADLYAGLWPSVLADGVEPMATSQGQSRGFAQEAAPYVTLLACSPGERAIEDGKLGGRFTSAFLEAIEEDVSLHRTSYFDLVFNLYIADGSQHAVCTGQHRARAFFDGVPFVEDGRFVAAVRVESEMRVEVGAIHGITKGSGLELYEHNLRGSRNPVVAGLVVEEVHPTWCMAKPNGSVPLRRTIGTGWVRVARWAGGDGSDGTQRALCVHLKRSLPAHVPLSWKLWKRHRHLSRIIREGSTLSGYGVVRVSCRADADVSLRVTQKSIVVEDLNFSSAANPRAESAKGAVEAVNAPATETHQDEHLFDSIAIFHYHLNRKPAQNSIPPFHEQVTVKLLRKANTELPPTEVTRLESKPESRLSIAHVEAGATYSLVLDNQSDSDLWPYVFWMDADTYSCMPVYQPPLDAATAPLLGRTEFKVPMGGAGATLPLWHLRLADTNLDGKTRSTGTGTGFFKVFLSNTYVPNMRILESGVGFKPSLPLMLGTEGEGAASREDEESRKEKQSANLQETWDAILVRVTIGPARGTDVTLTP